MMAEEFDAADLVPYGPESRWPSSSYGEDRCPVCDFDRNAAEGWCRCIGSSSSSRSSEAGAVDWITVLGLLVIVVGFFIVAGTVGQF